MLTFIFTVHAVMLHEFSLVHPFVHLSPSVCPSVCLSVCPSVLRTHVVYQTIDRVGFWQCYIVLKVDLFNFYSIPFCCN